MVVVRMLEDAHMAGVDVGHDCVWIYPDIFVEFPIFQNQVFHFQDVIEIQNAWLLFHVVKGFFTDILEENVPGQ